MSDIQDIKEIADHYGYDTQSGQLVEECAELIQAVSKLRRAILARDGAKQLECVGAIEEEIADVEIMLEQVRYLLRIPPANIESWKAIKILRQKERMVKNGRVDFD